MLLRGRSQANTAPVHSHATAKTGSIGKPTRWFSSASIASCSGLANIHDAATAATAPTRAVETMSRRARTCPVSARPRLPTTPHPAQRPGNPPTSTGKPPETPGQPIHRRHHVDGPHVGYKPSTDLCTRGTRQPHRP